MTGNSKGPGHRHTIVIVGAGFAGLRAARGLSKQGDVRVLLIDRRNHHLFQPLLYQVATAGLNPADIAVPIRAQFADSPHVDVHMGAVDSVDLARAVVLAGPHEVAYDHLVIATGVRHSYFGRDDWEQFAPGLKTLEEATEIRRRMLLAFEGAENAVDPKVQERLMTFVIVGAGPTGVELAGAIAEISRTVLVSDFRRIDPSKARVLLLEAGDRVLSTFSQRLSHRAQADLEALGVEVRLGARVEHIDGEGVLVGTERIHAQCVFWAAGVHAPPLPMEPEVQRDRAGRVHVGADFSLPGYRNVFVVGDMAVAADSKGRALPGLAPAAIQAGAYVARAIRADLAGKARPRFVYRDKGAMATIGKRRAIAQTGFGELTGLIAWLAWLFVHVYFLIGFKNRMAVLTQWVWSYVFSKRGARLIMSAKWQAGAESDRP